ASTAVRTSQDVILPVLSTGSARPLGVVGAVLRVSPVGDLFSGACGGKTSPRESGLCCCWRQALSGQSREGGAVGGGILQVFGLSLAGEGSSGNTRHLGSQVSLDALHSARPTPNSAATLRMPLWAPASAARMARSFFGSVFGQPSRLP